MKGVLACRYCGLRKSVTRDAFLGIESMIQANRCHINGKHESVHVDEDTKKDIQEFVPFSIKQLKRERKNMSYIGNEVRKLVMEENLQRRTYNR